MKRVSLIVLALAGVGVSQANRLVGWTDPLLGMSQAVTIDEHTGEAIVIGEIPVPSDYSPHSLTYDPTSGYFYGVGLATSGTAAPSKLAVINSDNGDTNWIDITGHPSGLVYFEGIEYSAREGSVIVSFAQTGSYYTTRLCKINLAGQMTAHTGVLPYVDADVLAVEPGPDNLHTFDTNNPTNGFKLNRIDNPFGSATVTGLYNGPVDEQRDSDVAAIDDMNPFLARADRLMQFDFENNRLIEVGLFGAGIRTVRGIAAIDEPMTVISGTITLGDYVGSLEGREVIFELYQNGTQTDARSAVLDGLGNYTLFADFTGTYQVRVYVPGWLAKIVGSVTLDGTRLRDCNVGLINGDIDLDNAITVFDYSILSDYFDMTSADPNWTQVGGNGFAPQQADLDGDEAVTVFDYSILSQNFDMVGD